MAWCLCMLFSVISHKVICFCFLFLCMLPSHSTRPPFRCVGKYYSNSGTKNRSKYHHNMRCFDWASIMSPQLAHDAYDTDRLLYFAYNLEKSYFFVSSFLIRALAKLIDPVKFRHRNVFYWLKLRNGQRKSSFDKVNQTRFICDSILQLDNLVSSQSVWSKFCTKN